LKATTTASANIRTLHATATRIRTLHAADARVRTVLWHLRWTLHLGRALHLGAGAIHLRRGTIHASSTKAATSIDRATTTASAIDSATLSPEWCDKQAAGHSQNKILFHGETPCSKNYSLGATGAATAA
jgi:hypothetical protein